MAKKRDVNRPEVTTSTATASEYSAAPPGGEPKAVWADNRIPLRVTSRQLADCIERQEQALARVLSDPHFPPIDGGLGLIAANLDALRRVVPLLPDPTEEPPQ